MSWGYRVTIICLGFVAFMSFMVVNALRQNFDLVAENYYAKELQFQNQIEKQTNQQQLKGALTCTVSDSDVIIKFPEGLEGKKIEGEIFFFRPSDAKKDFKTRIASSETGVQHLDKNLFARGLYRVQFDYIVDGKKYYCEKPLMIQ